MGYQFFVEQLQPTKIGTQSVHVGSLSEASQDTCTSVNIVTILNYTRVIAILQVMLKPSLIAMLCLMYIGKKIF